MKTHRFILAALLASLAFALPARAAETIAVRALLIVASNSKGPADPKLAQFEAELQRNFPESSFRLVHEGSTNVADGGRGTVSLGSADKLELEAKKSGGDVNVNARWLKGGALFFATAATQRPGVPIVMLRRPANDSETPIVLIIAK